ncbi:L-carnitine dehydrogenase [Apiospora arundinis]|uniref:Low-density lipoprotein receptor YWTD n=1 Tax=Apiospora arundinis TaxID=335852 RepID=A0ABR2IEN3_9PEZI
MGSAMQPRLYVLDTGFSLPDRLGSILSCLTDGSDLRTVIAGMPHNPDGIAIDHAAGRMYWTNMGPKLDYNNGSLESANLDGSDRQIIVPQFQVGAWTPKQIALASQSRKLYWSDREGMKVMRCNLDGSDAEVLVSTGSTDEDRADTSRHCVGIAVDESRGCFYWSQKGPSKGGAGRIFRSPMDVAAGTKPEERPREMLLGGLPEPIDLEVEAETQTLFWTDRGDPPRGNTLNKISLADLAAASKAQTVIKSDILARRLHEAIGLSLDHKHQKAYVTDLAGGVYSIDLKTKEKTVLFPELGDLTGIAIAHL